MSATYIPAVDFVAHKTPEDMSRYAWNDRVVDALFCKSCGIFPYFGNEKWGYRVNLGCVEQLDAMTLEIGIIDGKSMPIAENPEPHPGHF
jgi:hypothetical protein